MTNPYPDWPWWRVKSELAQRGLTLAAVSRAAGKDARSGKLVSHRLNPSLQAAIALAIGLSPMAIWPSRYQPDGQPVRPVDWFRARGRDCYGRPLAIADQQQPQQKDDAA